MKNLKLYVWEDVLTDYTSGVIFALAENLTEAKRQVLKKTEKYSQDRIKKEMKYTKPKIVTDPEGFLIWGGG